jgi:hypothetical protein
MLGSFMAGNIQKNQPNKRDFVIVFLAWFAYFFARDSMQKDNIATDFADYTD